MKILLKILLLLVLILWAIGAYFYTLNDDKSAKFIGFGVITLTFVLMPLFIYHRYKDKDLTKYSLKHNDPDASKIED
ncbi:hypothetical protein AXE80_00165 [Wenyingzhuangia fucanilytica]|uniref:Isoleucyl-tRNA synthetase n=1 Tax=Wenyingzhuangia fucanilytica TaxID=1790137 RepID=A0A1B1Y207_9FLAO|nr:hypothetical protein [Wenyingzhuangia fucanilytica]ANW94801.1 hypothetical protein AXE80_00165 [Wenyingzhuangia fucanilytica]